MASETHAKILLFLDSDILHCFLLRSVVCDNGTGQWILRGDYLVNSNLPGS